MRKDALVAGLRGFPGPIGPPARVLLQCRTRGSALAIAAYRTVVGDTGGTSRVGLRVKPRADALLIAPGPEDGTGAASRGLCYSGP